MSSRTFRNHKQQRFGLIPPGRSGSVRRRWVGGSRTWRPKNKPQPARGVVDPPELLARRRHLLLILGTHHARPAAANATHAEVTRTTAPPRPLHTTRAAGLGPAAANAARATARNCVYLRDSHIVGEAVKSLKSTSPTGAENLRPPPTYRHVSLPTRIPTDTYPYRYVSVDPPDT